MTSLPLFPTVDHAPSPQKEWGTGSPKTKVPLWSPKPPTWHQNGQPIAQFYDLTKLKKSNVRWNDQLLPKPQEADISQNMINLPFPAEHPYSSHTARFAIFPSFAVLAEESKRGWEARASLPLSAETPASAPDVRIVHKIKGFGERHEIQTAPPEGLKRGLTWHAGFDQKVKVFNDRPPFYPVPTKTVAPNITPRHAELAISEKTADGTRNLERQQWKTSYDLDYTGLGQSNPLSLDNYDDKMYRRQVTGIEDNSLMPHFKNTFDPARPYEGRVAQLISPRGPQLTKKGAAIDEPTSRERRPTLAEREEQRLLHGAAYVSLPEVEQGTRHASEQWHEWSQTQAAEPQLDRLAAVRRLATATTTTTALAEAESSGAQKLRQGSAQGVTYLDELRQQQADDIQQMEARNRWKLLESQAPGHEVAELGRRLQLATTGEKPAVFYGQEGLYNEERAGLYKTAYDPARLRLILEQPTSSRFDTSASHVDALTYPTALNALADATLLGSRTFPATNVPMFSEMPSPADVLDPFTRDTTAQALLLQPTSSVSRPRVQEGHVVHRKSEHGSAYNTEKFLQQYDLPANVRSEALALMSSGNQNLGNVRANAVLRRPETVVRRPETVAGLSLAAGTSSAGKDWMQMTRDASKVEIQSSTAARDHHGAGSLQSPTDGFVTESAVRQPRHSSPGDIAAAAAALDLSFKHDEVFAWVPGCGVPRPQSDLLAIQNSFTKSAAHQKLHRSIAPDGRPPSLIKNVHTGRKHEFGLNAQVLRGAAEVH